MLSKPGCTARVARLRAVLEEHRLDAALLTDVRDLWYFLGLPLPPAGDFPAAALIETGGEILVFTRAGAEPPLLADRVEGYAFHVGYTRNLDNLRSLAALAGAALHGRRLQAVGYQAESLPQHLATEVGAALGGPSWYALDEPLLVMQRAKDPDELALLRRSITTVLAAYEAIEATIAPGVSELAVLAAGQQAAMEAAGEPLFHSGDYQCASAGGPARDRRCAAGELFIVDAWSIYQGYWSDLCRTFAVSEATELQESVFEHLTGILGEVPERLRPGLRGTELWAWMDARIREHPHLQDVGLAHHAGHGVGLRPHTAPDLNRDREGILAVGDVVSVEPGAYTEQLRAGIRVENTFLITDHGCELLSDYPLALERNRITH